MIALGSFGLKTLNSPAATFAANGFELAADNAKGLEAAAGFVLGAWAGGAWNCGGGKAEKPVFWTGAPNYC